MCSGEPRMCVTLRAVGLQAAERLGMVAQGKVSTGKLPSGTGFSWDASKAKASSLLPVFQENGVVECKEVFDHMAKGDEFATETLDEVFERIAVLCEFVTCNAPHYRVTCSAPHYYSKCTCYYF